MPGAWKSKSSNSPDIALRLLLTRGSEIAMPTLSSLSLAQQQGPPRSSYQSPTSPQQYYQGGAAPLAPMSPPAEPQIQSWAREDDAQPPEQPQPRASMQVPPLQMWNPEMGIKFGPAPGAGGSGQGPSAPGGRGQGPVGGQWDPNSGIRFG